MNPNKRTLSALICLGFVLLLTLTQVCSIHVLHHHPVGESCAVCHQVQENRHRLHQTAHTGGSSIQLSQSAQGDTLEQGIRGQEGVQTTLISLKVKLTN